VEEHVDGVLVAQIMASPEDTAACQSVSAAARTKGLNPAIKFLSGSPNTATAQVFSSDIVTLESVVSAGTGAYVIATFDPTAQCRGSKATHFMGLRNGSGANSTTTYYRYDPRLKMLDNTLQAPSGAPEDVEDKCPAVVKNFINSGGCTQQVLPLLGPLFASDMRPTSLP